MQSKSCQKFEFRAISPQDELNISFSIFMWNVIYSYASLWGINSTQSNKSLKMHRHSLLFIQTYSRAKKVAVLGLAATILSVLCWRKSIFSFDLRSQCCDISENKVQLRFAGVPILWCETQYLYVRFYEKGASMTRFVIYFNECVMKQPHWSFKTF